MRFISLLSVFALIAVMLAGCSDAADEDTPEGDEFALPEEVELSAGKGAIAGLVIDDRFRPIPGALVLLQETGGTTTTTENGEFSFIDLEPATYTLKVNTDGHEASPQTVDVTEGLFAEANIVARRLVDEGGTILTREFTVFIPCGADALVVGTVTGYCPPDLSGESFRSGFESDYRDQGDNITAMVTEVLTNQEGGYTAVIRATGDTSFGGEYYAEADFKGQYQKITNWYGQVNEEHNERGNVAWVNAAPFETILFIEGEASEELGDAYDGSATCVGTGQGLADDRLCRGFSGVGAAAGVKAQFVQSLFLGEPEVDVTSYCVLC